MPRRAAGSPSLPEPVQAQNRTRSSPVTTIRHEMQRLAPQGRNPPTDVPAVQPNAEGAKRRAPVRARKTVPRSRDTVYDDDTPVISSLMATNPRTRRLVQAESADAGDAESESAGSTDVEEDKEVALLLSVKDRTAAPTRLIHHSKPKHGRAVDRTPIWMKVMKLIVFLPISVVIGIWLCVVALAVLRHILRHWGLRAPLMPLEYITWSVGSNALYTRECITQLEPIKHVGRVLFNKADVESLAKDVQYVANDPSLATRLLEYVNALDTLQAEVRPLNLHGTSIFRDIVQDLVQADKLLRHLRGGSGEARDTDAADRLLRLLHKLYKVRLPRDLRTLNQDFLRAHSQMHRLSSLVQALIPSLQEERLASILQLTPPTVWRRLNWERDDVVQRRVKHANLTVESFQRTMELGTVFDTSRMALERYLKSLSLFEDPRAVAPSYKRSNGTLEDFVNILDEVVPQLQPLVGRYGSP